MEDPLTLVEQYPSLLPTGDNAEMPLITLRRSMVVLGTREDAHVQLKSHTVSRTHAVIVVEPSGAYIHDLASREGVYVNRQPIHDTLIEDGDEIRIGRFEFIFQSAGLNAMPEAPKPPPAAYLRIKVDRYPLAQRVTSIGRRQGMDVILDDEAVSATHALIYAYQGKHFLRDLNSRTGVLVNGNLLNKKHELRGGDVIRIGPTTMRYVLDATGPSKQPAHEAADEGMTAAMMQVVAAEEPDLTPPNFDDAACPSPDSLDEPTAHWEGSGDSDGVQRSRGATALLESPATGPALAVAEPSTETSPTPATGFHLDGLAIESLQETLLPAFPPSTQPAAKELHHVIVRKNARSTLVITPTPADRCPARLLLAQDHPLCNAAEVTLEPIAILLATEAPEIPAPPIQRRQRVATPAKKTHPAAAHRAPQPPTPAKPKPSKYTASGEYRIDLEEEDDDKNDPRAAMHRTAVAFMQDSIIGMPVAEVEAAPDPFTLGDVFKPKGRQLPGLVLSYHLISSTSGPNRRPPTIPPRIPPRPAGR